jgi:hypothetical protein
MVWGFCYIRMFQKLHSISGRSSIYMTFHKRAFDFFLYHYHGLPDMTRDKSLIRPCASAKSL